MGKLEIRNDVPVQCVEESVEESVKEYVKEGAKAGWREIRA
jgi:hypothetical protein